jgi:polyisoprenoid-binding protein YceI
MTSSQRWQSSAKWTLVAVVGVVVIGSLGFYWLFLRGDAPDRARLPDRSTGTTVAAGTPVGSPEGEWRLTPGEGIFVGYRVQEQFAGDTIENTAVGRTIGVSGAMTVADGQVTAVTIEADLSRLVSDEARRDDYIRTSGLETNDFPTATFTLTEPIVLPADVPAGQAVSITAVGDLTLHGVTRQVEIPLEAQWDGSVIDIAGGVTIVMTDYDMEPPSNSLVSVADEGELEIQVSFARVPDSGS